MQRQSAGFDCFFFRLKKKINCVTGICELVFIGLLSKNLYNILQCCKVFTQHIFKKSLCSTVKRPKHCKD